MLPNLRAHIPDIDPESESFFVVVRGGGWGLLPSTIYRCGLLCNVDWRKSITIVRVKGANRYIGKEMEAIDVIKIDRFNSGRRARRTDGVFCTTWLVYRNAKKGWALR